MVVTGQREIEILVQVRHQFISQIANRSSVISAYVYLALRTHKVARVVSPQEESKQRASERVGKKYRDAQRV
jgi:hypothetical protein